MSNHTSNFTDAGRRKAHSPRIVRCCWPGGCSETITARSNVAYCAQHRLEGKRLNYQRQHIRRQSAKSNLPSGSGRPPELWTVLHDPDGDFTNRQFSSLEVSAMLRLFSFSPGAILQRGEEVIKV